MLVIEQLDGETPAARLAEHPALLQAALGERKKLSAAARSLATPLSYYEDDLILLTWSAAIVIEPDADAREDAALLLEFANTPPPQLRRRGRARAGAPDAAYPARRSNALTRSPRRTSSARATLITDINETNARVENALGDRGRTGIASTRRRCARYASRRGGRVSRNRWASCSSASVLRDEAQEALGILLEALVIILIVELVVR